MSSVLKKADKLNLSGNLMAIILNCITTGYGNGYHYGHVHIIDELFDGHYFKLF